MPLLVQFCALPAVIVDDDPPRAILRLLDPLGRLQAATTTFAAAAAAVRSSIGASGAVAVAFLWWCTIMPWAVDDPLAALRDPCLPQQVQEQWQLRGWGGAGGGRRERAVPGP